jgi:leucyl aminopeptidase (aminopeptidase T)
VVEEPVLGYGWPDEDLELTVEDGVVTEVAGDPRFATGLAETIETEANAGNVAELAFGINPHANRETTSVWKKGWGRTHIGIGNGLIYDQDVD